MKNNLKKLLFYLLEILFVSVFPVFFLFFNNIGDVRVSEFVPVASLVYITSIIGWGILSLITKSGFKGAVFTTILILLFENFQLILQIVNKIAPQVKYWHLLIVVIYLLAILIVFVSSKINQETANMILSVALIVFCSLAIINFISAVPKIFSSKNEATVETNVVNEISKMEDMPNVYWLIFDEYSAFDVIQKYYDYSNEEFVAFLEEHKFSVSKSSVNESQQSNTILCNYAHLDYVTDDSVSYNDRADLQKQGIVFDLFRQYGYEIDSICGGAAFGLDEATVESTSMSGETFSDLIYKNTVIYPFMNNNSNEVAAEYDSALKRFENKDLYVNNENPRFIFSYFNLPHQPFVFDANGNEVSVLHQNDWVNKEYYLNQYIYTTMRIEKVVSSILQNDPDSVIIIQSDHSARSLQSESGEYLIDKYDRRHCLNVVYFRGDDIEIEGLSGTNTLRYVFGKILNVDMPTLEVPDSEYEF